MSVAFVMNLTPGVSLLRQLILIGFAGSALFGQTVDFRTTLYPVLEKANCRACHNSEGVASATRLHFPEADASESKIPSFWEFVGDPN